jgi:hypothetical protein
MSFDVFTKPKRHSWNEIRTFYDSFIKMQMPSLTILIFADGISLMNFINDKMNTTTVDTFFLNKY